MYTEVEEIKNNSFYQLPKRLFEKPYDSLNSTAKIMYSLLFDRRYLSIKNGWHENGEVYVYYTNKQFMKKLNCSESAIVNAKKELRSIGLIKEERQGFTKPNKIFVKRFYRTAESNALNDVKGCYRTTENVVHEHGKTQTIKTDNIKTNNIKTDNIKTNTSTTDSSNNNIYINENETETATAVFDYYQNRIGLLDGYQMQKLKEYIALDNLEPDLIKIAIDKSADNNKRMFSYVNSILKNWSQNGINTVTKQKSAEKEYQNSKDEEKVGFGIEGSGY